MYSAESRCENYKESHLDLPTTTSKILWSHDAFSKRREPSIARAVAANNSTWCRASGRKSSIREFLLQVTDNQRVRNQFIEIFRFEIEAEFFRKRGEKSDVRHGIPRFQ